MSLTATIKNAISSAFLAVGDIKKNAVLVHYSGEVTRDPYTGKYEKSETRKECGVVLTGINFKQFTNPVYASLNAGDMQVLVQASEVIDVWQDDIFEIDDESWKVVLQPYKDLTKQLFKCFVRKQEATVNG